MEVFFLILYKQLPKVKVVSWGFIEQVVTTVCSAGSNCITWNVPSYSNEICPFQTSATLSGASVSLGELNITGTVQVPTSLEVIDATQHAILSLGETITLST